MRGIYTCQSCGAVLTETEFHFFTVRCEECELAEVVRHCAWMDGADDPELDKLYGDEPTAH
jgi:hypothetical protein